MLYVLSWVLCCTVQYWTFLYRYRKLTWLDEAPARRAGKTEEVDREQGYPSLLDLALLLLPSYARKPT